MRDIILYLLILFQFTFVVKGQKSANLFRHIDSNRGLSNNQINTVFQDSNGFMWFATKSGLNRYDGYAFKIFKNISNDPSSIPENSVNKIYEDHLGVLWLFTDNDLFYYFSDTESFSFTHPLFQNHILPSKVNISSIINQNDSILWIANSQSGLYYYEIQQDSLKKFYDKNDYSIQLTSDQITDMSIDSKECLYVVNNKGCLDIIDTKQMKVTDRIETDILSKIVDEDPLFSIFIDKDDYLWINSERNGGGVIFINSINKIQKHFDDDKNNGKISNPNISGILEDDEGRIWIGTDHGGINIIDKENFTVETLSATPGDATSLVSNSVTSLFKSKDNIIWIGSYKNGINYYSKDLYQFELYRSQPHEQKIFFDNDVNCFAEDKHGNLWIGTNGDGLVYFNRANNSFKRYNYSPNGNSISSDVIVSLCYDSKNRLWIGTYLGGLDMYQNGYFKNFKHDANNPETIADDRIWQIIEDSSNRVWIGTLGGGLDLYDEYSNGFVHYKSVDYNSVSSNFILALYEDYLGNIWIGTPDGLNQLDIYTQRFKHYKSERNNSSSLSSSFILSISEDSDKNLWVGTRNGINKFDRETNTFKSYGIDDGLPDNNIISIIEDNNKNIWISTLNGLSNLVKDSIDGEISFRNFDLLDGLQGMEFNEHSFLKTSSGEIIFGGANGFNIFRPDNILSRKLFFDVLLTDIELSNKGVDVSRNKLFHKALHLIDEIQLKHNENSFTLEFAALNYFHPERTRFKYMLEGFETVWTEVGASNRLATYTNLNPGTYVFKIHASASDGSWDESKLKTLKITVAPPFYGTPLAYLFYFVIFIVLIYFLVLIIRKREEIKFRREREIEEHKRRHEIDSIKLRLFTNISHEFKTPLTLILTPVEKLLNDVDDEKIHNQLIRIKRNGLRLLSLINQLLDFRKIEAVGTSLIYTEENIIEFIKNSSLNFKDLFESKSIEFEVVTNTNNLIMKFDKDKIDKIISNLLSNAYKFSPEKGKVSLELFYINRREDNSILEIKVRDNGVGISLEHQENIFERFFQAEKDNHNQLGSGIGLSITNEYVKAHGGVIRVNSVVGKGTVFTISLPTVVKEKVEIESVVSDTKKSLSTKKHTILIVEDSKELRDYMRENLEDIYDIIESENGVDGFEKAKISLPDVIISDIMMSGMNGIDMCKNLKSNNSTKHIPILLLTANSSRENELESLEAGAEDYITKPFNLEALLIKLKNIISQKQELDIDFGHKRGVINIEPKEIEVTSEDEKLIKKITSIIEKNMSKPDFTVAMLSDLVGVSRGHLYNKVLAITGNTPTYLIRIMRIKRAAQYLEKSQLTVAEVAYKVGFNEPKYFSRYFKDEYGISPTKYIKQNQK